MTESSLADWLRPAPGVARVLRAAWLGRTSTDDQQDPTLSLPRQLGNSERALPEGVVIAAHFYDVESSRRELGRRGSSRAWEQFDIPIPRDGGMADLLAEARRPDRRFDVVIVESVDRIARFAYQGTGIEHELELLGIPLLASDEPIMLDVPGSGRKQKRASGILLRRTKQGVAEWYIVEMLEKSWDGFEVHTSQGWNVGKPPYGYIAEKHKHPVPAKRAEGKHKTKLGIDPERGPTVTAIFNWRVTEKLSRKAIAARLNANLDLYLPPQPVDPTRAVGKFTASFVGEVLINPKYTGHMVWNRRSTKDKLHPGKVNSREEWIISPEKTHPELISVEIFLAAQAPTGKRFSRSDGGTASPNAHRQTKRVYRLRSYVWCRHCVRRMYGRTLKSYLYYSCQPRDREVPHWHPPQISVPEAAVIDKTTQFFNTRILGAERMNLARAAIDSTALVQVKEHDRKVRAFENALADIDKRRQRLLHLLETQDDDADSLFEDIKQRRTSLDREYRQKAELLAELIRSRPEDTTSDLDLLDHLPTEAVDLDALPPDDLRSLFDSFDIKIEYDVQNHKLYCHVTISGDTYPHILATLDTVRRPRAREQLSEAAALAEDGEGSPLGSAMGSETGSLGPQKRRLSELQLLAAPRRGHHR